MFAMFDIIEKEDIEALNSEKDKVRSWFNLCSRKVVYEHDSPDLFAIGFYPDDTITIFEMEKFCRDLKHMVLSRFVL